MTQKQKWNVFMQGWVDGAGAKPRQRHSTVPRQAAYDQGYEMGWDDRDFAREKATSVFGYSPHDRQTVKA